MRTEDLIRTLAADGTPAPPLERGAALALGLGGAASLALFLVLLGPRPDFEAFAAPLILAKPILPALLAAASVGAALRAVRPGAPDGPGWILAVPALAAAAFAAGLGQIPPDRWLPAVASLSALSCMTAIPLLALPVLAGLFAALRRGAPARPGRAGFYGGLAAGGLATVFYATFCNQDSPLFYVTWYSAAILVVGWLGARLGPRLLRW